ncbi:MAG: crotonase/enoyl-CoA hydratase family protein [Myxococcales bacterium]|nr:crotonase/enoyl-CoA hydratase family protein [Myxococcales bacterium]
MTHEEAVRVEKKGSVTTVILSRPQARNAVDAPTAESLAAAFLAFERDDEARVAVFYGEDGVFCAGADLRALSGERGNRVSPPRTGEAWDRLAVDGPMGPSRMLLSKPVVAAIAGHAVAGGLELALWCDLRVAEENAVLGVFCRRWGVPLLDGGTVRLPRLIGQARAMDLILTGRPVEAEEALAIGLVNRVVARGSSREAAEELAREIARFPQVCVRADRRSAYEQWDMPLDLALANEYDCGMRAIRAGESFEGAQRFASGRGRGGRFDDI